MLQLMTGALKIGPCCSSISAGGKERKKKKKKRGGIVEREVLYRGLNAGSLPID